MFDFSVKEVPRSIFFKPFGTVIYSKRKWSIAFDDSQRMSMLVPSLPSTLPSNATVTRRLVARSLFGSSSASSDGHSGDVSSDGLLIFDAVVAADSGAVGLSGQEEVSSPVVFATESKTRQKN